ncbi:MAG TPA: SGNH/GDSL hydrolase family protein [Aeromicrobium sp.]|nr:SGNH/GDSL hydrolase family protein [Aeromicrobium sp.]
MPNPRRRYRPAFRTAAVGAGAATAGMAALLAGEVQIAKRSIGMSDARPPSADGVYGDDLPGRPVRCLILGDSAAVGYGMTHPDETPPALIGISLSHLLDAPVHIHSEAVVGARSEHLREQINRGLTFKPDVAVIIIGTNDITHRVPRQLSTRRLGVAVRRLVEADCDVVVGTVPDLGTVRPIPQPLRTIARWQGHNLARAQMVAVVSAGGRAVSLGDLLGPVFSAKADIMFGTDRFHPSATGYANVVSVLVPSIAAAIREPEEQETITTTMPLEHAAAVAELHVGTEVRREGRRAAVQRRVASRRTAGRVVSRSRAR